MKKALLTIILVAFGSPLAYSALPPDCGSVFTTATIAANTSITTAPWLSNNAHGVFIQFSSATTSAATEDVYGSNDNDPANVGVIMTTSNGNTSIVNPSAAAPVGFIVQGVRFYRVAVSGWSSGTLTTTSCSLLAKP